MISHERPPHRDIANIRDQISYRFLNKAIVNLHLVAAERTSSQRDREIAENDVRQRFVNFEKNMSTRLPFPKLIEAGEAYAMVEGNLVKKEGWHRYYSMDKHELVDAPIMRKRVLKIFPVEMPDISKAVSCPLDAWLITAEPLFKEFMKYIPINTGEKLRNP